MQEITSILAVIAVWLVVSLACWRVHRVWSRRTQRRKLALANEAWMRVREAPEIFADIRAAGAGLAGASVQDRTNALLSRVREYGDYFDDVSALRAQLARTLDRDDCPPLTELLNMRRDIWAAADMLLIDNPHVFGDAFAEPGSYEAFCDEAREQLFLDAPPDPGDPMALRLAFAEEDMQTFVSGVEGEIADERERERLPTWREIIAYPVASVRAVPALAGWLWRGAARLARGVAVAGRAVAHLFMRGIGGAWRLARRTPAAVVGVAGAISARLSHLPRLRPERAGPGASHLFAALRRWSVQAAGAIGRAARAALDQRHPPVFTGMAAFMRRAGDRFPGQVSQGLARAAEMTRDARARATAAAAVARERAQGFAASELGLHYDFLIKAHALRQKYADRLGRAQELSEAGRQFIARLQLEKRAEQVRLGTAKLRRRARLETVRVLSIMIAALERLRDRLADTPTPAAQATGLLASPLETLFLPAPSPRQAGARYPGGLRAQARAWARGWRRSGRRMRDVSEETGQPQEEEPDPGAASAQGETHDDHPREDTQAHAATDTRNARAAPPDVEPEDPTRSAIRRVRRLFGIRDRDRRSEASAAPARGAARMDGAATYVTGDAGQHSEDRAGETNGTGGKPGAEDAAPAASEAQILPPLRGWHTGYYDEHDDGSRSRSSLQSRLSSIRGHDDESLAGGAKENRQSGVSEESSRADQLRQRKSRWRQWFGTGRGAA